MNRTGTPLFPSLAQGNVENVFPLAGPGETKAPEQIALSKLDYDFEVSDPLGTDLYIMIASQERLDPSLFSFQGIRGAPEGKRGAGSPLGRVLFQVGSGTRGVTAAPVGLDWSIQKRVIRSK